jgi:hypothetical protein
MGFCILPSDHPEASNTHTHTHTHTYTHTHIHIQTHTYTHTHTCTRTHTHTHTQASGTHRRLDIKIYPASSFAFALLYFTGSDHFNRSMRFYAKKQGWTLSDHGLAQAQRVNGQRIWTGQSIACSTENEVFEAMGLTYVAPKDRNTYNNENQDVSTNPMFQRGMCSDMEKPTLGADGNMTLEQAVEHDADEKMLHAVEEVGSDGPTVRPYGTSKDMKSASVPRSRGRPRDVAFDATRSCIVKRELDVGRVKVAAPGNRDEAIDLCESD